jgi:hypothetical protein
MNVLIGLSPLLFDVTASIYINFLIIAGPDPGDLLCRQRKKYARIKSGHDEGGVTGIRHCRAVFIRR